ncbi:MAG: hypothetical protein R6W67_03685, partial [Bacteroidales bacterium]
MRSISVILILAASVLSPSCQRQDSNMNWPMYRGQSASGVLEGANLPLTFDLATGENVKWNIELPALGLSSPVIWRDKLFITTAISQSDDTRLKPGIFGDISSVD